MIEIQQPQTQEETPIRKVKFFKEQYNAIQFKTQFAAAVAGVQSGKTFLGAHWAGLKATENPGKDGIIVAPSYKILQQATLRKFFDVFPNVAKYYKGQREVIELPNGTKIWIRSADNPYGIEGISPMWWWFDEGGQASQVAWTVLRSRVSMTGGQGLITTTPYNVGWLFKEFYIPWKDGIDKNLSFFTWRSIDNPAFSKEFYEAERSRLRPEEFARRYEGRFEKMSGLVFDITQESIIDPIDIMAKADTRIMGVDWGYENPAGILVLYLYDKKWYIVDEWKFAHRTTKEIIQVMKNKLSEHHINLVYADPAEPDRIEECRREKFSMMETNKDIQGGISKIQQLINEKRLFVFNNCKEFISEASMYHYPEIKDDLKMDIKDVPMKINDHLMDCMRYVIHSYEPLTNITQQASSPILPFYPELGF